MKYLALGALVAVLSFVGSLLFKLGVHKDVHLTRLDEGPFRQVYKLHVGPYHKTVSTIVAVEEWAKSAGEKCELSFGEYLDNPKQVDEDRLQSNGGCFVTGDYSAAALPKDFKYREIARRNYIVATFAGSPSIAPYKVYPKALEYFKKEIGRDFTGAVMEVYKIVSEKEVDTKYYLPN